MIKRMKNAIIGIFVVAIMLVSVIVSLPLYSEAATQKLVWVGDGVKSNKSIYGGYDHFTFTYTLKNTTSNDVKFTVTYLLYDTYDDPDRLVRKDSGTHTVGAGEIFAWNRFYWEAPNSGFPFYTPTGWKEHVYKTVVKIEYMGGALEDCCYHRVEY